MPVQVPVSSVSVLPWVGVPVKVGTAVLVGGSATTVPVAGEVAVASPATLVAVTRTRTLPSTSAPVSV